MAFFVSKKLQELPSGWGLRPQAPMLVTCSLASNHLYQNSQNRYYRVSE